MLDVGRHPNIVLMAYSEVESVRGEAPEFRVTVRKKARYVDEEKCTGCGACKEKCPTVVPDMFNMGLGERKAIYSWFAQGIPSTHTIDPKYCRQLNGKKCGVCKKTCPAGAIDFDQKDTFLDIQVSAIIVATGYSPFDPSVIPEYGYGKVPNVITSLEFERLLSASGPTEGHLYRPSEIMAKRELPKIEREFKRLKKAMERFEKSNSIDSERYYRENRSKLDTLDEQGREWIEKYERFMELNERIEQLKESAEQHKIAKRLAFVQCVGSRDKRFYPFCSSYCCMHSIKEAIIAHEHEPDTRSTIFGMDIRAVGKGFEEYKLRGAHQSHIRYVRGRVGEIVEGKGKNPVVVYEDTNERKVKREEFDLVILATACVPSEGTKRLSEVLGVELTNFGFFKTKSGSPLDTTREGIFVCGCAHSPMDIPESVAQASGAASRVAQFIISYGKKMAAA